jgi:glycosyltransferase involved in cell wall biosynthesis
MQGTDQAAPAVDDLRPIELSGLRETPLVSVLMANYNYAEYLGAAIESVIAQTYTGWELVVCDDGSTDGSANIIEHYASRDSRIRMLRTPNGGHTSALNASYEGCGGDVVCLLDSDDLCLPTKIEQVINCFRSHPKSGLVAHRMIHINSKGQKRGMWPLMASMPHGWCAPEMLANGGILNYLPPTSGISLRREVAEYIFPVPAERPLYDAPDQVIGRLAPLLTRITSIDEPLSEYRLHANNSYATARVSVASVTKELVVSEQLWKAQRNFLSRIKPSVVCELRSLEKSSHILFLRYLSAKLSNDPAVHYYHRDYIAGRQSQPRGRFDWLWGVSIHLPQFLFEVVANLLLRQNFLKQAVARLRACFPIRPT